MATALAESWVPDEPDVMEVTGRLDSATAPRVEEDVFLCIHSGARRMVLDCRELSYVTSAGLRAILAMARAMQKAGGRFAVCDLQPQVEAIFEASGFKTMIPVFSDRNEAITAFAG